MKGHELYCDGTKFRPTFRGVLHLVWFLSTPAWAYVLLSACPTLSPVGLASFGEGSLPSGNFASRILGARGGCWLYMFGWAFQYGASAIWHMWPWIKREHEILANHADHVGIFLMIACSYMVPCGVALPQTGHLLASGLWTVALIGSLNTCGYLGARGGRTGLAGLYVFMGSLFLLSVREINETYTTEEKQWGLASLAQYFLSACIYVTKRPDPWPRHFGCHECFHVFVCAGSACSFMSHLRLIQRVAVITAASPSAAAISGFSQNNNARDGLMNMGNDSGDFFHAPSRIAVGQETGNGEF